MDRLTERFSNGQVAVYGCGSNCKYDFKYCNKQLEDCPTINEIYERLAQYEEIGLTPEQLLQVDKMYTDRCREIAGLERKIEIVERKGDMERLTIEYCGEYVPKEMCSIDRLGGADDCDLCCEYCKATEEGNNDCRGCAINQCFNKLGEYEDLEEQGKLLKLPCKAGQKVYLLRKDIKTIIDGEITSIRIGEFASDMKIFIIDDNRYTDSSFDKIGEIVFFTREEAEAALKES